jgi:hypothetical protein
MRLWTDSSSHAVLSCLSSPVQSWLWGAVARARRGRRSCFGWVLMGHAGSGVWGGRSYAHAESDSTSSWQARREGAAQRSAAIEARTRAATWCECDAMRYGAQRVQRRNVGLMALRLVQCHRIAAETGSDEQRDARMRCDAAGRRCSSNAGASRIWRSQCRKQRARTCTLGSIRGSREGQVD